MATIRWYHGGPRITDWDNIRWDRERSTSDLNAEGPGMYWTTDPDDAWSYARGPDAVVYEATLRDSFRPMPKRKPTMNNLRRLYDYATADDQRSSCPTGASRRPRRRRRSTRPCGTTRTRRRYSTRT